MRERDEAEPSTHKLIANLNKALETRLGSSSEKLEEFGFRPRKKAGGAQPRKGNQARGGEKPAA